MKNVAIIGAGLGGLAASILLGAKGYQVDVYEKHDYVGGKMRRYAFGGARFDFGPNTLTMPEVFKEVYRQSGVHPDEYVSIEPLTAHTANHFSDGSTLTTSSDLSATMKAFRKFGESNASVHSYIEEVTRLYELASDQFFPRTFASVGEYVSPKLGRALLGVRPLEKMDSFHRRFFKDERVVQMLNRYATYIGSSPYYAPATFAMIAYFELVDGVFFIKGGNPTLAEGFRKRAEELGVRFHLETEVKKLETERKNVSALELVDGRRYSFDAYLLNGDYMTVFPRLVDERARPSVPNRSSVWQRTPSSSAFVIMAATSAKTEATMHHQVYFSPSYKQEFEELFTHQVYPSDPTIYICNSSVSDPTASEEGDNLFILVNAPALKGEQGSMDTESYKAFIYDKLEEKGVHIRPVLIEDKVVTPNDIAADYDAFHGGLYGASSNRLQQAFLRPANKSRDLQNLYFSSGSTHPGGGSPMVVQSGMNVAQLIGEEV
ncbi:phytoene desaturase family protein [Shouchella shacheensis]|uniref:phytoene desaturase family protein n=1 Tax=Shouchella shacheensis TaxID=1649580 RepID=UPI00073FD54B|nr:phytoene desaturase family protein [Shouchella shacheensis]